MKNVVKINVEEFGIGRNFAEMAPKRGLVFSTRGKNVYGVDATTRNTDMRSILKSVLKLALSEERVRVNVNATLKNDAEARISDKQAGGSDLKSALMGRAVAVTDKLGFIIQDSWVKPKSGKSVRAEIMPKKTSKLYYAAVLKNYAGITDPNEIPWDDLYLSTLLNAEIRAIEMLWDYCDYLDEAIEHVAQSNMREDGFVDPEQQGQTAQPKVLVLDYTPNIQEVEVVEAVEVAESVA